jgi:mono/diheme cytochrome c family protein
VPDYLQELAFCSQMTNVGWVNVFASVAITAIYNVSAANAALPQATLREQALHVMKAHCGACHTPHLGAANLKALRVFDLTHENWIASLRDSQLQSMLARFESRQVLSESELKALVPEGAEPPFRPSPEELRIIRSYILQEQLSRLPGKRVGK